MGFKLSSNLFLLFFSLAIFDLFGQRLNQDSLQSMDYDDLSDGFYEFENDKETAILFAKEFLNRAKNENDIERKLHGYFFLSSVNDDSLKVRYADSIVIQSGSLKEKNEFYPYFGYLIKAEYYFKKRNFKNSLSNYLKAYTAAKKVENTMYMNNAKLGIGLIKSRLGHNLEALEIYKSVYSFSIKNNFLVNDPIYHLGILSVLSESYRKNDLIDSSSYLNRLGHSIALEKNLKSEANYSKSFEGVNEFYRSKYMVCIDSISKGLGSVETKGDDPNLAEFYYYLGMSHLKLNHRDSSLNYFNKVDAIFNKIGEIHPDLRNTYTVLIEHYGEKQAYSKQLYYIKQLLRLDSIYHNNYKSLYEKLNLEYDTPRLISKKNTIIKSLENKGSKFEMYLAFLISLILFLVVLYAITLRKNKRYKQKFDTVISELKKLKDQKATTPRKSQRNSSEKLHIDIPANIVNEILENLKLFEENKEFVDNKLTLSQLAQRLRSNSSYVSKVINVFKGGNYSKYINDLRVEYAAERLRSDNAFRNYKVSAIALEVGFKSSESFSRYFYKKYGIKPSFFIKELDKNEGGNE